MQGLVGTEKIKGEKNDFCRELGALCRPIKGHVGRGNKE